MSPFDTAHFLQIHQEAPQQSPYGSLEYLSQSLQWKLLDLHRQRMQVPQHAFTTITPNLYAIQESTDLHNNPGRNQLLQMLLMQEQEKVRQLRLQNLMISRPDILLPQKVLNANLFSSNEAFLASLKEINCGDFVSSAKADLSRTAAYLEAHDQEPLRKKARCTSHASTASADTTGTESASNDNLVSHHIQRTQDPQSNCPRKKDEKWFSTYKKLKDYKEANGDTIVPRGYSSDPRLASWVAEQRKQYKLLQDDKQSSITSERVALLEELGFAWNAQEAAWTRHMDDLKKFRDEVGHCHVPLNHPDYPKLGLWVKEQRRHYTLLKQGKPSHMTHVRAAELDKVGFCWDTHEATWLERFKELTQFKEKHGHCIVPTNYSENTKLGTWVHHQRRQYKKHQEGKTCHITGDRIRALAQIGFVWNPRERSGSSDGISQASDDTETLGTATSKVKQAL